MIQTLSIQPRQVRGYTEITFNEPKEMAGFPLLSIDRDSYIVGVEIQSGLNFDFAAGRHCIAIGKTCSLAEKITFMIDLNHDYRSVSQGDAPFLDAAKSPCKIHRKGSIILQNDVWVGHSATIMPGVILRNGCAVATNAVVTKDVPPYAIVAGNPARIIKYRFDEAVIDGLQRIAWWDWPPETLMARQKDFSLPAEKFVEKYLPCPDKTDEADHIPRTGGKTVLFIPDIQAKYPLYPRVLAQYFEKDRPDAELLLYLPEEDSDPKTIGGLERFLKQYEARDCLVTLQTGETLDEPILFQMADYFVTTRCPQTVGRTCLADRYGVRILFGTDAPIFPDDL